MCVTSSPILPSPRVEAKISLPLLYLNESERPSIFGSTTYFISEDKSFPKKRLIDSSKFSTSELLKALAKESNGLECSTLLNEDITVVPIPKVLSLSEIIEGNSFINLLYLSTKLSYSLSDK